MNPEEQEPKQPVLHVLCLQRYMTLGGRWERGSGLGTYVHPWQIHVNVCQNQYTVVNIVKINLKKELIQMYYF